MSDKPSVHYNVRRAITVGSDLPTYIPGAMKGLSAEDEHELEAGRRGVNKTENERMVDLLRRREYHKDELASAKDLIRIAKEKTAGFQLAGHLLDDLNFEKDAFGGKLLGTALKAGKGLFSGMGKGLSKMVTSAKPLKLKTPRAPIKSPVKTPAPAPVNVAAKPTVPAGSAVGPGGVPGTTPPPSTKLNVSRNDYRYGLKPGDVQPPPVKAITTQGPGLGAGVSTPGGAPAGGAPGGAPAGGAPGGAPAGGAPGVASGGAPDITSGPGSRFARKSGGGGGTGGTDVTGGGAPGNAPLTQADVAKQIAESNARNAALEGMSNVDVLKAEGALSGKKPGAIKKFLASGKGEIAAQMAMMMFPYHKLPGLDDDSMVSQMAPMAAFMLGPGAIAKYTGAGAARASLGKSMAAGKWAPKVASRRYRFEVTTVTTPGVINGNG